MLLGKTFPSEALIKIIIPRTIIEPQGGIFPFDHCRKHPFRVFRVVLWEDVIFASQSTNAKSECQGYPKLLHPKPLKPLNSKPLNP